MKKIRLFSIFIGLLFLSGCWDMREINDLGFVTAVGIDKAKPPNRFSVTVQIANAGSAAAKSEQGQTESGVWTGTTEGRSIFAAVRNLIRISSRRVMWAHNNVIFIGQSLAKAGIFPVVDFFTHNPELRMKTPVVVARGDAKDFVLAKAGMETPSGLSFIYFNDYSALLGASIRSSMLTVDAALANPYIEPLIAVVNLKKVDAPPESGSSGGGKSGGKSGGDKSGGGGEAKTIDLSGAAVFKKDKLAGWLSPRETRGIAWVRNETRNIIVTVKDPMHANQSVAVQTEGIRAKINTQIIKGMPRVVIRISGGGKIVEEDGPTNLDIGQVKKQVERLLERKIAATVKAGLKKIQREYRSDVIGLAAVVHTQHNRAWENGLKARWREIFPQIPIEVQVRIRILSNTLKQEPARENGALK